METLQELKAKSYDVIQRLNQIDMHFKQANDEMNNEYQRQITPLRIQLDELNGKMRALDAIKPTEDTNKTTVNILPEGSIDVFKEKEKPVKKKVTPKKK